MVLITIFTGAYIINQLITGGPHDITNFTGFMVNGFINNLITGGPHIA